MPNTAAYTSITYTYLGKTALAPFSQFYLSPEHIPGLGVEMTKSLPTAPLGFEDTLLLIHCALHAANLSLAEGVSVEMPVLDRHTKLHIFGGADVSHLLVHPKQALEFLAAFNLSEDLLQASQALSIFTKTLPSGESAELVGHIPS